MSIDPNKVQDQFNTDYNKLLEAATQYQESQKELKAAEDQYKNVVLKKLDSLKSAEAILIYLITQVVASSDPNNNATILGISGDQLAQNGKALQVNSYLTAVHNDIQKLTGSDSDDPKVVDDVAKDLDKILDQLKNNKDLQNAMDPTALSQMTDTDTTLRHMIFDGSDSASGYNPTGDDTYYFTYGVSDSKYLTSFAEMEKYMKEPGDQLSATEAYKGLSDNFNSDTSMTQTMNAKINEIVNNLTTYIKTVVGFLDNGLCQPIMKGNSVAINNQKTS